MRLDAVDRRGDLVGRSALFHQGRSRASVEAIYAHYGPVLAGGRLVVASSDGVLRFFSPTDGALVGHGRTAGRCGVGPGGRGRRAVCRQRQRATSRFPLRARACKATGLTVTAAPGGR